jgi:heterodisulfide reductase subunit B2
MKLGYYPGCSLMGMDREFNESVYALARRTDLHLVEIPDWNCCGSTAAHNVSRLLSLALPARNLALAEKAGLADLLVPCSACYQRLVTTQHELMENEELRKEVIDIIEMDYKGATKILNIIEGMVKIFSSVEVKIEKPLSVKVACYYGCLMVRPPKVMKFDRAEDPQSMDELMKKFGAEPVDWPFKTECCGAGLTMSRTDLVCKLSAKIIESAIKNGAEIIIVACPMCHANLDMRRADIEKAAGKKYNIPVLYLTQAIGLALGIGEKELGIHRHFVPFVLPEQPKAAPSTKPAEPAKPEAAEKPAAGAEE